MLKNCAQILCFWVVSGFNSAVMAETAPRPATQASSTIVVTSSNRKPAERAQAQPVTGANSDPYREPPGPPSNTLERALELNRLGELAAQRFDYPAAESNYRHALAALELAGDAGQADLGRVLANLGTLMASTVRYVPAMSYLERSIAANQAYYGDTYPNSLPAMNVLADLYLKQQRHADAEHLLNSGLATIDSHADISLKLQLETYTQLAALHQATNRPRKARQWLEHALQVNQQHPVPDQESKLSIPIRLAELYQQGGEIDKAQQTAVQVAETAMTLDAEQRLTMLPHLAGIARLLGKLELHGDTIALYKVIISDLVGRYGDDSRKAAKFQRKLIKAYEKM